MDRKDDTPVSEILENWLKGENIKICEWCKTYETKFYRVSDGRRSEVYRATPMNFESLTKAGFVIQHICEDCAKSIREWSD